MIRVLLFGLPFALLIGCANRPVPACLSTVTVYVDGGKNASQYGDQRAGRGASEGYDVRGGVSLEFDATGYVCQTNKSSE